jgi:8-oxo-dGTP pyrophosphatase MutT (NUDIX family)
MSDRPPRVLRHGDPALGPTSDLAVARAELAAYVPADEAQHQVQEEMLHFVDAHPDALLRSCLTGHLTGSALVVDADGERILLLFHRKVRRWLQPGGHVDGDANLPAAALREATEETGIADLQVVVPAVDLDIHQFRAEGEPTHLHLDSRYLVLAPPGAEERGNDESEALRWVTLSEMPDLDVDEGTLRLAARGLEVARALLSGA